MKKRLFSLVLALCCASVFAGPFETIKNVNGTLNIADTIPYGDQPVKNLALLVNQANPQLAINIGKVKLEEAVKQLEKGEVDLIFAEEHQLPESLRLRRRYAAEVALVIVNTKNTKTNFLIAELHSIFTGSLNDWMTLNGSAYSLHRMGISDEVPGSLLFQRLVLKGRPFPESIYRKADMGQLLVLTAVNANSIAFVGYPDMKPGTDVREVSINGIAPTVANLNNGTYPLMGYRVAVMGKSVSPQARIFLQLLNTPEFTDLLKEDNLYPMSR